jgi:hypothetical protein
VYDLRCVKEHLVDVIFADAGVALVHHCLLTDSRLLETDDLPLRACS